MARVGQGEEDVERGLPEDWNDRDVSPSERVRERKSLQSLTVRHHQSLTASIYHVNMSDLDTDVEVSSGRLP